MIKKVLIVFIAALVILGISKISLTAATETVTEEAAVAATEEAVVVATEEVADVAALVEAVEVGNKICPVSGEEIKEESKATYEYEGKIYSFCCPMCIDEFKKDPSKYIQKVEEEKAAAEKMDMEAGEGKAAE
jgi:YHS domain-containing protein